MPNYLDCVEPELVEIKKHAARVRIAIERTAYDDHTSGNMKVFPKDCCHHACKILGLYLFEETRFGSFETLCGKWKGKNHCWLAKNGIIVDITADQFNENRPSVIVTRRSDWHDTWVLEQPSDVLRDRTYFDRIKRSPFYSAIYDRIIQNLPPLD